MNDNQTEKDFKQHMAFNVEAVRSGLFNSAMDIAKTMQDGKVPHAEAILLTAAVEFAAQLWTQTMLKAGHPPKKIREQLEKEIRFYHRKHLRAEQEGAQPATKQ